MYPLNQNPGCGTDQQAASDRMVRVVQRFWESDEGESERVRVRVANGTISPN